MKKISIALAALLVSLSVNAGTATYTGSGTSSREPEFITLAVTVSSECYSTPSAAMAANNATAIAIQDFLQRFIAEGENGGAKTSGGITSPYSRTIYDGHESRTVCQGTFQQSTNITFTTTNFKEFSHNFARIQEELLGKYQSSGETNAAVTYASIGQPSAGVCRQTREKMKLEALTNAHKDAFTQFNTMANSCGISGNVEITTVGEIAPSYTRESNRYAEAGAAAPGGALNISFDTITEYQTATVKFTFPTTTFSVCKMDE